MKSQYTKLKSLTDHPGWEILKQEWLAQITKIEECRDKAAKRGSETAWRYWAGQEYGAKLMTMTAEIALANMEKENLDDSENNGYEDLLKEARGEV